MNSAVRRSENVSSFLFVGTVIAATASAVIFLFLNFQTKSAAEIRDANVEARLIRIEEKIDRLR